MESKVHFIKEDCLMVSGAPEMLDILAEGNNQVTVWVNTSWISGFQAVLSRKDLGYGTANGDWGFYYTTLYQNSPTYDGENPLDIHTRSMMVGLCPVSSCLFGGSHPNTIYIKKA